MLKRVTLAAAAVVIGALTGLSPAPAQAQRIYQEGQHVYLDNDQGIRLGIRLDWGGVIDEVSQNGENFVDHNDDGRDIQLALFDGNRLGKSVSINSSLNVGYDPNQGGDYHQHGSPVIAISLTGNTIYTKTQPYEWNPDDKGGGPNSPVLGDAYMEQWISFLPGLAGVFHIHYRVTHFGQDEHAVNYQGLPAIYTQATYDQVVSYTGPNPWQGDATASFSLPVSHILGGDLYPATENWLATVTSHNFGLTVYFPDSYSFFSGLRLPPEVQNPSNFVGPYTIRSLLPGDSFEGDYYVITGDYREARQQIYQVRATRQASDVMSPFGSLDGVFGCAPSPQRGLISGSPLVSGWAFDNVGVTGLDFYVDGVLRGQGIYGNPRPDVASSWPALPNSPNFGFSFKLDTSLYKEGSHILEVKVRDQAGNISLLHYLRFRTSNLNVIHRSGAASATTPPSVGREPIVLSDRDEPNAYGFLDAIDASGAAVGWAVDPDVLPLPIGVKFYVDGPWISGTLAGSVVANVARPSLDTQCGFSGNHGFSFVLPPRFRDGHPHAVYAYAIDVGSPAPVLLSGSPMTFSSPQ